MSTMTKTFTIAMIKSGIFLKVSGLLNIDEFEFDKFTFMKWLCSKRFDDIFDNLGQGYRPNNKHATNDGIS